MKIAPIDELNKIHQAKFMYQHKQNKLPKPFLSLYNLNIETHQHNIRHRQDPHTTLAVEHTR